MHFCQENSLSLCCQDSRRAQCLWHKQQFHDIFFPLQTGWYKRTLVVLKCFVCAVARSDRCAFAHKTLFSVQYGCLTGVMWTTCHRAHLGAGGSSVVFFILSSTTKGADIKQPVSTNNFNRYNFNSVKTHSFRNRIQNHPQGAAKSKTKGWTWKLTSGAPPVVAQKMWWTGPVSCNFGQFLFQMGSNRGGGHLA